MTTGAHPGLCAPVLLCAPESLVMEAQPLYSCHGGTSGVVVGPVLEQARKVRGILLWGGQAGELLCLLL